MDKHETAQLETLERNFRDLIIEKCKFCRFDKFLEENPDFEFPKITENCSGHITIPGMFGGFDYFVEEEGDKSVLYTERSSRMDYSSDAYSYYEVSENGNRLLQGEERKAVQEKFGELSKKAQAEWKREMEEMRRKHESGE